MEKISESTAEQLTNKITDMISSFEIVFLDIIEFLAEIEFHWGVGVAMGVEMRAARVAKVWNRRKRGGPDKDRGIRCFASRARVEIVRIFATEKQEVCD
jgi:hypothetical protein